jgi:hypothetical protein
MKEEDEFDEDDFNDDFNIPLWIVVGSLSLIGLLLNIFF